MGFMCRNLRDQEDVGAVRDRLYHHDPNPGNARMTRLIVAPRATGPGEYYVCWKEAASELTPLSFRAYSVPASSVKRRNHDV